MIKIIPALLLLSGLAGCAYEDYIYDYDYSAVYFGAQRPLRTLVTREGSDYLEFKIGVALGGLLENKKGYTAKFAIDPNIMTKVDTMAKNLTLLPPYCYTIENSDMTFVIPAGKFIGDCPVKINKAKFVALPGSLTNTYALPLRLLETTADSIPAGKDYTTIVIKYIDEKSGYYYVRGTQTQLTGDVDFATPVGTVTTYNHVDLSQNRVRSLTTLSMMEFDMKGLGTLDVDPSERAKLALANDGTVTISQIAEDAITDMGGGSYNAAEKSFNLHYKFTKKYEIKDSKGVVIKTYYISWECEDKLILRQDVEKELRFEVWAEAPKEEPAPAE